MRSGGTVGHDINIRPGTGTLVGGILFGTAPAWAAPAAAVLGTIALPVLLNK